MERVKLCVSGKVDAGGVAVSERGLSVAAMFGVGIEGRREEVLFEDVEVEIGGGDVVLITGPSGAGKSTLLRGISRGLEGRGVKILRLSEIAIQGERAVADCFGCSLEEALGHLSRSGLSEAHVLLRSPGQLSEGQQFRYRLARFFASDYEVLVADEFCATLDRVTAKVVAHQLGKFVRGSGKAAVVATTHEDLSADLRPSVALYKCLGNGVEIFTTENTESTEADDDGCSPRRHGGTEDDDVNTKARRDEGPRREGKK